MYKWLNIPCKYNRNITLKQFKCNTTVGNIKVLYKEIFDIVSNFTETLSI